MPAYTKHPDGKQAVAPQKALQVIHFLTARDYFTRQLRLLVTNLLTSPLSGELGLGRRLNPWFASLGAEDELLPESVLQLPDLELAKRAVRNSLGFTDA
jgi:hypothetical protein